MRLHRPDRRHGRAAVSGAGRARCARPAARDHRGPRREHRGARPPARPRRATAEDVRDALGRRRDRGAPRGDPRRGGRQEPRGRGLLLGGLRADRAHPLGRGHLARRGSGHRPRRLRGRHLDARGARRARADHAAGRWSTPPSAGRPASTPAAGKNLVGAFYEPSAVLVDLATLDSLPPPSSSAGSAEIVKAGFIADPDDPRPRRGRSRRRARPAGGGAGRAGAARGQGEGRGGGRRTCASPSLREILNYGHTLGHAIERREGYRWRHGAAVCVGPGVRRRARPGRGPAGRRHRGPAPHACSPRSACPTTYEPDALPELVTIMRRRQEDQRRGRCGSSCSTASPSPGGLEDPTRAAGDRVRGRWARERAVGDRSMPQRPRRTGRRALRALLPRRGVDALLVTDLVNIRYLTGFTGSNAALLVHVDGDARSRLLHRRPLPHAGRRRGARPGSR